MRLLRSLIVLLLLPMALHAQDSRNELRESQARLER